MTHDRTFARRNHIAILALGCAVIGLLGCASTALVDVWRDTTVPTTGLGNVMVIAMRKSDARRRLWEDAFVAGLAAQGVKAMASYRLFPWSVPDTAQIRKATLDNGLDGAIVLRPLPARTQSEYVPGYVAVEPRFGYNWFRGRYFTYYTQVVQPGYVESTTIARHEIDVIMSGDGGRLVWTGTAETSEPNSVSSIQHDVAEIVVARLARQGIISGRR